jgi:hypothetical protein
LKADRSVQRAQINWSQVGVQEENDPTRHKARLIVKGYRKKVGIDYDEVFVPIA